VSSTSRAKGESHTYLLDGHGPNGCPTGRKGLLMGLTVQRVRSPGEGRISFTVVGGDGLPVPGIEAFLTFIDASGASPNTVAGYAYDLKDFFTWLGQVDLGFEDLTLEQVSLFFSWLRRPKALRAPGVFILAGTGQAVENSTLQRKRAALASFYRFHSRRDPSVPALLGELDGRRATGRFVPMLVHTRRGRTAREERSPIHIPGNRKVPDTLTDVEVAQVIAACPRLRDQFLIALLDGTGVRISEALGLRHEDLHLRRGEVHVVHREGNANFARVKGGRNRVVPVTTGLFDRYARYMEDEYGALDCDYVFVNLFRAPIGGPTTRANVADLMRRLRATTSIAALHPHAFRHTYATRLLRKNVPIEVVAKLLGHASAQTTAETYSHLSVEDHRRILTEAGAITEGDPMC
jgi:integrase/recombinase XerD